MLEELAYQYANISEDDTRLVSWLLAVAGAGVAALVTRSALELSRAPYFALSGFLILLFAAVSMGATTFIVQALVGGFFWVIAAVEIIAKIIFGFYFGRIAMARSRDAYGHGRMAALAFIPFANFWLLLTPSKNEISANRVPTIPLLTGGLGVLAGFVMLAGGISLTAYSQVEAQRAVESAAADGVLKEAMLDRILAQIAAEVTTPMTVDEVTTLLRMETEGKTLRNVYEISSDPEMLAVSMRTGLMQKDCTFEALRPVIEAGATIENLYLRRDGSEIGTVTITRQICGY